MESGGQRGPASRATPPSARSASTTPSRHRDPVITSDRTSHGHPPAARRSPDDEYRAVCMLDQFVADASDKKSAEVGKPARADHDKVCAGFFGSTQNLGDDPARRRGDDLLPRSD